MDYLYAVRWKELKRKRLDRDTWTSIISKQYIQYYIEDSEYSGIISVLYVQAVSQPSIWQSAYGEVTVCDAGMKWLQFLPKDEHYLLTAMMDKNNKISAVYIDIIAASGVEDDGVVYFDDLYLDLVVYHNGNILIDDRNELNMALKNNIITQEQYETAQQTQNKLLNGMHTDIHFLNGFCLRYLTVVESLTAK
jgi:uncharacterized protein